MEADIKGDPGWAMLAPPWCHCLTLAWESQVAGSVPVGAVILDGTGDVVASGRNQCAETGPSAGNRLRGTSMAHAEVNALACLAGSDPLIGPLTLVSTLEPCLLCTAAALHSHIATLRFAGPDPLWTGIDRVPGLNPTWAARWPRRERHDLGPFSLWSAALPARWALDHAPAGATATAYRTSTLRLSHVAEQLQLARHTTLEQALHANWTLLTET